MLPGFIAFLNVATCPPPQTGHKGKRLFLMQKLLLHATPVTPVKARLEPAISGPVDTHVPVSMCAGRQCRQPWKRAGQAGWGKGVCEARVLLRSSSPGPAFVSRWWAHITWSMASLPTPGRCQLQYLTSSGDYLAPYHCWHFLLVPEQPTSATWVHFTCMAFWTISSLTICTFIWQKVLNTDWWSSDLNGIFKLWPLRYCHINDALLIRMPY